MDAPEKITGMSLEWTGHHHSAAGDFEDLSTHTLTYVTDTTCFATAGGEARRRSDLRIPPPGQPSGHLHLQAECLAGPDGYRSKRDL